MVPKDKRTQTANQKYSIPLTNTPNQDFATENIHRFSCTTTLRGMGSEIDARVKMLIATSPVACAILEIDASEEARRMLLLAQNCLNRSVCRD